MDFGDTAQLAAVAKYQRDSRTAKRSGQQEELDKILAERPAFKGSLDSDGDLAGHYRIDPAKLPQANLDMRGINEIKKRAFATGPSAWASLMKQQQGQQQAKNYDDAALNAHSGLEQGMADLSMRGGLSEGSRERMAMQGAKGIMLARQGVNRQGEMDRSAIDTQDNQNQTDLLKMVPGMDQQAYTDQANDRDFAANAQKFNVEQALMDKRLQSADNLSTFQERMKAWAAGKTADSTENAGK